MLLRFCLIVLCVSRVGGRELRLAAGAPWYINVSHMEPVIPLLVDLLRGNVEASGAGRQTGLIHTVVVFAVNVVGVY
jgi:hypothetical protein